MARALITLCCLLTMGTPVFADSAAALSEATLTGNDAKAAAIARMSRLRKRVFKISSRPCNGVDERGLALLAAAAADAFRVKAATRIQPDKSRLIVVEVD